VGGWGAASDILPSAEPGDDWVGRQRILEQTAALSAVVGYDSEGRRNARPHFLNDCRWAKQEQRLCGPAQGPRSLVCVRRPFSRVGWPGPVFSRRDHRAAELTDWQSCAGFSGLIGLARFQRCLNRVSPSHVVGLMASSGAAICLGRHGFWIPDR